MARSKTTKRKSAKPKRAGVSKLKPAACSCAAIEPYNENEDRKFRLLQMCMAHGLSREESMKAVSQVDEGQTLAFTFGDNNDEDAIALELKDDFPWGPVYDDYHHHAETDTPDELAEYEYDLLTHGQCPAFIRVFKWRRNQGLSCVAKWQVVTANNE